VLLAGVCQGEGRKQGGDEAVKTVCTGAEEKCKIHLQRCEAPDLDLGFSWDIFYSLPSLLGIDILCFF
jgi:hypothetical protein